MMEPPRDWFFDDFSTGQLFVSPRRTLTESDIACFAAWSWDTNPVHTDEVHSRSGRFGRRIAHGLLGMSVAMGLAARLGVFEACSVALLGVDDWRFLAPLYIGDTVHAEVEITGVRLTSGGETGVLNRRFRLVKADGVVAQEGHIDLLVSRRNAGS